LQRKRPVGSEWSKFVDAWGKADHDGKVLLAEKFKVSYDLAKHWISDFRAEVPETSSGRYSLEELLSNRSATQLDFVSFDLETSNLQADFSVLLTASIKPFGKEAMVFRADSYPNWKKDRSNDKAIVVDIANELAKHAVIITHYGTRFDIPYFRAKMVKHGLPPLPQMFAVDSWRIARDNFQVSSRRLKNLAEFFEIGNKEGVEGGLWMAAAYDGSKEAMDKIVEHNVIDVEVLEKLACLSFPYLKFIRRL